jgi:phospho-N-acetylmuramoyl-pentapeptide-transferase
MNIEYTEIYLQAAKIFTYSALSFVLAMWWAPSLIKLLKWMKFWKKSSRNIAMTGEKLTATKDFYDQDEAKLKVPRAGGLLIWITSLAFALFFWFILKVSPDGNKTAEFLNFIDRRETFIPIGTLFFASIFGFIDDALATLETGGNYKAGGLKLSHRLFLVSILSFFIGLWFHFRLNLSSISVGLADISLSNFNIPIDFAGHVINGSWLIVPITMVILLGLYGSSMVDGFDGMSSGVLIPIYLCFAGIAFSKGFYDIATLLMVIVGSLAAYLWYNIPPAKFYMGDTGIMGLLLTLGVVAILLDVVYVLPIAGLVLVITEGSVIIQVLSKKFFKRKVFLAAPLHHHLESIGWLRHQVTMRYWLISIMASAVGFALGLILR